MSKLEAFIYSSSYGAALFSILAACALLFCTRLLSRYGPDKERLLGRTLALAPVRFLGSFGLAAALLLCLLALTYLGTMAQATDGLWLAQKRYFESWWVIDSLWGIPLVLPGGLACMGLLAINLLVGGMLRIRWSTRTAGVLVIHVGIAIMLLAGLVKFELSDEGHLTLYEGQESDEYVSYQRWEVAIWKAAERFQVEEHLIGNEDLRSLVGGAQRRYRSERLPFELRLGHYVENTRPMPKGPNWEAASPLVEGYALLERPREPENERNVAGLWIEALDRESGVRSEGLLWGFASSPWTFEAGGESFAVKLRKQRYPMPFSIRLKDFRKLDHPGMSMAASFESDVIKIEGEDESEVLIQMNEPLRHGGLVLFQANWGPQNAAPGAALFSGLAVVRNPADMWPEFSCWVIAVGLIATFLEKLLGYIRRQGKLRVEEAASE